MNIKKIGTLVIVMITTLFIAQVALAANTSDASSDNSPDVDTVSSPGDTYSNPASTDPAAAANDPTASSRNRHHHKAKFYTGKSHYHLNQDVKFILQNKDHTPIYVPCDGTIDVTHDTSVIKVSWGLQGEDGCVGYQGNAGEFELSPKHKISQLWDQTDEAGVVDRGTYKAYTNYLDSDDRFIQVKTNKFKLKN